MPYSYDYYARLAEEAAEFAAEAAKLARLGTCADALQTPAQCQAFRNTFVDMIAEFADLVGYFEVQVPPLPSGGKSVSLASLVRLGLGRHASKLHSRKLPPLGRTHDLIDRMVLKEGS